MRKAGVNHKKAKAIVKEAKENIDVKRAMLWSKELEAECFRIHDCEQEKIAKEEAKKNATKEPLHQQFSVRPEAYSRGTKTPVVGGITQSSRDTAPHHRSRSKSVKQRLMEHAEAEDRVQAQGRPSAPKRHRSTSRVVSRKTSDELKGRTLKADDKKESALRRSRSVVRKKSKEEISPRKESSPSATSKPKKKSSCCSRRPEEPASPEGIRHQHSRSRSIRPEERRRSQGGQTDDDVNRAIRRSRSKSKHALTRERSEDSDRHPSRSHSKHHHQSKESKEEEHRREIRRSKSESRKSHNDDRERSEDRRSKSSSRRRATMLTTTEVKSDEPEKPSRRSTMAVVGNSDSQSTERLSRRMSSAPDPPAPEKPRTKTLRRMSKEEFEAEFDISQLDGPNLGTAKRRESNDCISIPDCLTEKEKPVPLFASPEAMKNTKKGCLLPRRSSSLDDDDTSNEDDVSLRFDDLVFADPLPSPKTKTPKKNDSSTGNKLSRHLEHISTTLTKDLSSSKSSMGSTKSGNSKRRMVPVMRTSSSKSPSSARSTPSNDKADPAAPVSPRRKSISKLKSPGQVQLSPNKSSLRSSRYNQKPLKLPDFNASFEDFNNTDHDVKSRTSLTVSTVSIGSSDWSDFDVMDNNSSYFNCDR